jgi:hypothetical protein
LASKVHEFVDAGFRHDVFDCAFELLDLSFFVHELLFEFGDAIKELLSVLIIVRVAAGLVFRAYELGDVVEIVGIEIVVLFVEIVLVFFLLVEVVDGSDLLLFGLISIPLYLFHKLDLIGKAFPPELLPVIKLNLPVGQFLLQLLNIIIMRIMNPHIILFLLFEQIHLPLGLDFIHLVL